MRNNKIVTAPHWITLNTEAVGWNYSHRCSSDNNVEALIKYRDDIRKEFNLEGLFYNVFNDTIFLYFFIKIIIWKLLSSELEEEFIIIVMTSINAAAAVILSCSKFNRNSWW